MTHLNLPIVQAEFFHITNFKLASLDEVFNECVERVYENSRVKTTLRFYDDGEVLQRVAKEARLERLDSEFDKRAERNRQRKGIFRLLHTMRHVSVMKKMQKLRESRVAFMADQVAEVFEDKRAILIEDLDRSFRLLRLDEQHEVLEAIRQSPAVWIFLFDHNDLAADKQKILGSSM